jgi:hypothetical protein
MKILQRWKQTALHNKALVLTGAIVAVGTLVSTAAVVAQVFIARTNNQQTSTQIQKLIEAANVQAGSATRFADSAASMNSGIGSAVDKLNLQAAATIRLSRDAEIANSNTIEADRPWMGVSFSVADFDVGKKPIFRFIFANSGKRPAKVTIAKNRENVYREFPANPDSEYISEGATSTSIVVPGQNIVAVTAIATPVSQVLMDALLSGQITYFAFAKIEYTDIRTNKLYWTHECFKYLPSVKSDTDNGFRNCSEYNEAK